MCHDVYSLLVTKLPVTNTTSSLLRVGPLIPALVEPSMLELVLPAVLEENTVYNATILAINVNGETASNTHLIFSKFPTRIRGYNIY